MKLNRILEIGCSVGDDVRFLQTKLKDFGYYKSTIDGDYGSNTSNAVKSFQKSVGLNQDGEVGENTWAVIIKYEKSATVKKVDTNTLNIIDHLLPNGEYIKDTVNKKAIYLHHTAGGSNPIWTIDGWLRDGKPGKPLPVATSYVIGRKSSSNGDVTYDGSIYRSFDDKYWAYHLGISAKDSVAINASAIGIEVCNYGYVTKTKDGKFINYVNREVMASEVTELDEPFRGYKYWEKYTDAQIESLRVLILDLIKRHDIKIQKGIYNKDWFEYSTKWFGGDGLRNHTQVRKDKVDMYPCPRLIKMLNSL